MAIAQPAEPTDRRRIRGLKTRQAILDHAAPVRDSVLEKKAYWSYSLKRAVTEAQHAGEIDSTADPEQLAWELDSLMGGANSGFKSGDGLLALERGRRAIRERLTRAATTTAKPLA